METEENNIEKSLLSSMDKILNNQDKFQENESTLKTEMKEIEGLYQELKTHYDKVKNFKRKSFDLNSSVSSSEETPKTFPFLYQQGINLINAKNLKFQILKELNDLVKTQEELSIKEFTALLKREVLNKSNNEDNSSKVLNSLVKYLIERENKMLTADDIFKRNMSDANILEEKKADDIFQQRLKEIKNDYAIKDEGNLPQDFIYKNLPIDGVFRLVIDKKTKELFILKDEEELLELEEVGYVRDNFSLELDDNNNFIETKILMDYVEIVIIKDQ